MVSATCSSRAAAAFASASAVAEATGDAPTGGYRQGERTRRRQQAHVRGIVCVRDASLSAALDGNAEACSGAKTSAQDRSVSNRDRLVDNRKVQPNAAIVPSASSSRHAAGDRAQRRSPGLLSARSQSSGRCSGSAGVDMAAWRATAKGSEVSKRDDRGTGQAGAERVRSRSRRSHRHFWGPPRELSGLRQRVPAPRARLQSAM